MRDRVPSVTSVPLGARVPLQSRDRFCLHKPMWKEKGRLALGKRAVICCSRITTWTPNFSLIRVARVTLPSPDNFDHVNRSLKESQLSNAIALKLSQCMITRLVRSVFPSDTSISEANLFHRKMSFVSEETAVLAPLRVIFIAVTVTIRVSTRTIYCTCTCTLVSAWCTVPVCHLGIITWYPPTDGHVAVVQSRIVTLVLDKLFTV